MTTKVKPKAEDRIAELEDDVAALLEAVRLVDTQPGVAKQTAERIAAKHPES